MTFRVVGAGLSRVHGVCFQASVQSQWRRMRVPEFNSFQLGATDVLERMSAIDLVIGETAEAAQAAFSACRRKAVSPFHVPWFHLAGFVMLVAPSLVE